MVNYLRYHDTDKRAATHCDDKHNQNNQVVLVVHVLLLFVFKLCGGAIYRAIAGWDFDPSQRLALKSPCRPRWDCRIVSAYVFII